MNNTTATRSASQTQIRNYKLTFIGLVHNSQFEMTDTMTIFFVFLTRLLSLNSMSKDHNTRDCQTQRKLCLMF
jgi:hypothetical protein